MNQEPPFPLHKRTQKLIDLYLDRPSHGLLINAPEGSGKQELANWLTQKLKGNHVAIEPEEDKKQISIEQIKSLYKNTRSSQISTIIINKAHSMSHPAQNAFLKLLEEPPHGVRFIATTTDKNLLLSTILSRMTLVELLPPTKGQILAHFTNSEIKANLESTIFSTKGKMGLISKIINNEEVGDQHRNQTETAKEFYQATKNDRFEILAKNGYEREWSLKLLGTLAIIIEALLKSPTKQKPQLTKLCLQAELVNKIYTNLALHSGNTKIHLSQLAIEL